MAQLVKSASGALCRSVCRSPVPSSQRRLFTSMTSSSLASSSSSLSLSHSSASTNRSSAAAIRRCLSSSPQSSLAPQQQSSTSLLKTIESEIQHEKASYEPPQLLSKFLNSSGFKLTEKPNDVNMSLSKDLPDGTKVTVEYQLVSPFQPDGEDEERGERGGGNDTAGGGAAGGGEMTDFSVTVEKPSPTSTSTSSTSPSSCGVTFYCTTLQNDEKFRYIIGNVRYFGNSEERNSAFSYNGPEFEDLDDQFQEGLDEWLGSYGVDGELCDFIDQCSVDKEHREYVRWLENIQSFVKK